MRGGVTSRSIGPRPIPPPTRERNDGFHGPGRLPPTSGLSWTLLPLDPDGPSGISTSVRPRRFPAGGLGPRPPPRPQPEWLLSSLTPLAGFCNQSETRARRPIDWTPHERCFRPTRCQSRLPAMAVRNTSPEPKPRIGTTQGTSRVRRETPSQRARSGAEANSMTPEHPIVTASLPLDLEAEG